MQVHSWPGNVRELWSVIERSILAGLGASNSGAAGAPDLAQPEVKVTGLTDGGSYTDLKKQWVDQFEREYLKALVQRHRGNVSASAREARLDRSNFLRLMRRHGLKATSYRAGGQPAGEQAPSDSSDQAA
jgi:DNA-binding NtrC family response regulator